MFQTIRSAIRDERSGKLYLGQMHIECYAKASKALKKPVKQLVPHFDEGFLVDGKYLTRLDCYAKFDIEDSGEF